MASPRPPNTRIKPSTPGKDQPASANNPPDALQIALPKNLAQTLQFLSDDNLRTLRISVEAELERRRASSADPIAIKATAPQSSIASQASRGRQGTRDSETAIPAGRVSLIKASYHAGMKPVAIARTLRVSLSIVNEVLDMEAKAKR